MKRRRMLSLPLLPTITEALEDLPVHPSSSQSSQGVHSLNDYMTSIQALARPAGVPSCGPVRLQRLPRLRLFSKPTSVSRVSPLTQRTSRTCSQSLNRTEDFSLQMRREQDSKGKDPVDWLFGQKLDEKEAAAWKALWVFDGKTSTAGLTSQQYNCVVKIHIHSRPVRTQVYMFTCS